MIQINIIQLEFKMFNIFVVFSFYIKMFDVKVVFGVIVIITFIVFMQSNMQIVSVKEDIIEEMMMSYRRHVSDIP